MISEPFSSRESILHWESPMGWLELAAHENGITRVTFLDEAPGQKKQAGTDAGAQKHLKQALRELREYFAGERTAFDLILSPEGTEFQQAVWRLLQHIPAGETRTYQQLADALDNSKAVRAVGAANGQNPLAIVVPCHRVIGADGTLTGYAGGLERKAWLLRHEGYRPSQEGQLAMF